MIRIIAQWFVHALALYLVAYLVPGVRVENFAAALIASVVLGALNIVLKPILVFFTLPITILSLGLFLLVINAIVLTIAGAITPGFVVDGLGSAILGSIVLTVITMIFNQLLKKQ